jgi:hypothetical protein
VSGVDTLRLITVFHLFHSQVSKMNRQFIASLGKGSAPPEEMVLGVDGKTKGKL